MADPSAFPGVEAAEQAAAILAAAGMPRMPARVMMALAGSPDTGYTAAELGERLGVSPAAVSGGVRYLQALRLVQRVSVPGERVAHYDLVDDAWQATVTGNLPVYERLADLVEAIAESNLAEPISSARAREMGAFFRFMAQRMPGLIAEWEAQRGA